MYLLSGIAPLAIRRDVCARVERPKQLTRQTHSLLGQIPAASCLKSRHFLSSIRHANFLKLLDAANGGRDCEINRT